MSKQMGPTGIEFNSDLVSSPAGQSNTRSAAYWTETICTIWQKTAQGIFDTGCALLGAEEELDCDVFKALRLPFGLRTKQRLMAIARHPILATHVSRMPPSWGTLYELTKIPPDILLARIEDGTIHPGLERKDVAALLGNSGDNSDGGEDTAALEPAPPVLLDVWTASPLKEKQAVFDHEGRAGMMKIMSPALLAELEDALIGQEIHTASTSTKLAVNCTKLLQSALAHAADGPLSEINAKLKASGRKPCDVLVAINTRVKGNRHA